LNLLTFPRGRISKPLALELLRAGVTNSDRMRDRIRREKQLILQKALAERSVRQ
jgi:hypothetical protein